MYTQYSLKQRGPPAQTHPRGPLAREVKVPPSADSHLHVSASLCANYSLTNRASGWQFSACLADARHECPSVRPHQCGLRVQALKWQLDWTTAKIRDIPRRERKTYSGDLLLQIVKCLDWLIHNTDVETLQVIRNTEIIHTEANVQQSPRHKKHIQKP